MADRTKLKRLNKLDIALLVAAWRFSRSRDVATRYSRPGDYQDHLNVNLGSHTYTFHDVVSRLDALVSQGLLRTTATGKHTVYHLARTVPSHRARVR